MLIRAGLTIGRTRHFTVQCSECGTRRKGRYVCACVCVCVGKLGVEMCVREDAYVCGGYRRFICGEGLVEEYACVCLGG